MKLVGFVPTALAVFAMFASVLGVELDITSATSIGKASALVAQGLMDYYTGNNSGNSPGMFSPPYYWWEAGVAWGTMLDYGFYNNNDTYNSLVHSSLLYQSGDYWNYMTFNQTSTEGNDDQAFWGISAMQAAEKNFTAPGKGWPKTWLYFAQATWNTMAARWDDKNCGGGLRWQIYTWNAGYDYKNMVSNGCLFHLAARLARFTENSTFVDWSEKIWDWAVSVKFIGPPVNGSHDLRVIDGAPIAGNCSSLHPYEWTYNQGLMMAGCAYLYNYTGDPKWLNRLDELWGRAQVFFSNGIMYEAACQPLNGGTVRCNNDQRCFKGIFSRFLGLTMLMVPQMYDEIMPFIKTSAEAAAQSCSGGTDGHTCGLDWTVHKWDGYYGLGEQICALDTFNTLLISTKPAAYTARELYGPPSTDSSTNDNNNGTNSVYGYGNAGLNSSTVTAQVLNIDTADKAGAGILTAVVVIFMICGSAWLIL